jgi:hypothetical protein
MGPKDNNKKKEKKKKAKTDQRRLSKYHVVVTAFVDEREENANIALAGSQSLLRS